MGKTSNTLGSQRLWRLWSSRLWILSIILAIVTIASLVMMVHDTHRQRQAASLVAVTTAQQIAGAAHSRLAELRAEGIALDRLSLDSARAIARPLFDSILATEPTLAHVDSTSVRVVRADGAVIYGARAPEGGVSASLNALHGRDGLSINVALSQWQIPGVFVMPISHMPLLHNGIMILATLVVTSLAFAASRREAALASARGDFIAGVSHDLRMPLAQILLAGETMTLRTDLDADERSSLAHSIVRESKRLISLVENILLFSRTGAAGLTPRRDIVAVAELFAEVADATRLAAEDAGQSVDAGSSELAFTGDALLVRQAVVNLVDNALKYGTRGQRVALSASRVDGVVRLFVDDQGPGIPREERERVFEPYERLGRDQSSERTGTGLGLAVVNQIARASGGRVWLGDSPAGGTRAVLELPA